MKTIHIISGPTAVGKTEYALSYAEAHNAEIVSCDASLVYRGMDIGTAKPTAAEQARVPHHMIDVRAVDTPYDIVAYDAEAREAVAEITARGKAVLVTGGSGFYLKSFMAPVTDGIVVSTEVRAGVEALFNKDGLPGLLAALRSCGGDDWGSLDSQNPRRVMRALERCRATGRSLMELQAEFAAQPEPYPAFKKHLVLLERDAEALRERVAVRAEGMLASGLIEEVRGLQSQGIEKNPSASSAIGYRETLAHLRGELERSELPGAIIQNTMHLVKKQRTWFRSQIRRPDERIVLS
ncbi:MAG: tRNA (adenosine(37)-N6)-dimethylallyltransferase MiaA [Verrucomicrobia bacterium]|nr:tRNA (adenosine(37)-N6)-dimethylallyltransferase MiaA [Verrucomicrobiota bacterium]